MNVDILKQAMQKENINISDLAKRANVGQATISEILSGARKDLRLKTAKKIANVLGVTLEDLCKGEEEC